MSMHDSDDATPLDVEAIARDDAAVEALRRAVSPDALPRLPEDDDAEDRAFAVLRDLLDDVSRRPLPSRTVVPLAVPTLASRRLARRGSAVTVATAAALSFGGIAAASTAVGPGNPLRPLGDALRAAGDALVGGVVPEDVRRRPVVASSPSLSLGPSGGPGPVGASPAGSSPVRPSSSPTALPTATMAPGRPTTAPSRAAAADAATSRAAAAQVDRWLDEVEELLDAQRFEQADKRLTQADERLAFVRAADGRAGLQRRAEALRSRLDARPSPSPTAARDKDDRSPQPKASKESASSRATPVPRKDTPGR